MVALLLTSVAGFLLGLAIGQTAVVVFEPSGMSPLQFWVLFVLLMNFGLTCLNALHWLVAPAKETERV